jgi:nucleoside-triphosphatase
MNQVRKNILITGVPGSGKTTAVVRLAEALRDFRPAGFYTSEVREASVRRGFELVGFDGQRALLAHVAMKGPYRVGRYGVDIRGFEDFLGTLDFTGRERGLVIIDEIGKMECHSERFTKLVKDLLGSGKPMIATIAQKGEGFISEVKRRGDVDLFELTQKNRATLTGELAYSVKTLLERR